MERVRAEKLKSGTSIGPYSNTIYEVLGDLSSSDSDSEDSLSDLKVDDNDSKVTNINGNDAKKVVKGEEMNGETDSREESNVNEDSDSEDTNTSDDSNSEETDVNEDSDSEGTDTSDNNSSEETEMNKKSESEEMNVKENINKNANKKVINDESDSDSNESDSSEDPNNDNSNLNNNTNIETDISDTDIDINLDTEINSSELDDTELHPEQSELLEKSEKIREFLKDDYLREMILKIDHAARKNDRNVEEMLDNSRKNDEMFYNFTEEILNIIYGPPKIDF